MRNKITKIILQAVLVLIIISLSACSNEKEQSAEEKFLSQVLDNEISPSYDASQEVEYISSGGGTMHKFNFTIQNEKFINGLGISTSGRTGEVTPRDSAYLENKSTFHLTQKEILKIVREMDVYGDFNQDERDCHYGKGKAGWLVVCFSDNNIVTYKRSDGPTRVSWFIQGYDLNFKSSNILNSIGEEKIYCIDDSDCAMIQTVVCSPDKAQYPNHSCRSAVNKKYSFVLESVPEVIDECIEGICADYFEKPVCKNKRCEVVPVFNEREELIDTEISPAKQKV